jgi:hypothetical protein
MRNQNWYYLCDLVNKVATDMFQLPDVWGNITGMAQLTSEEVADLGWAGLEGKGLLPEAAALDAGVSIESIAAAKEIGAIDCGNQARNKRDLLLSQSDWTQVADAPVDKIAWATYRQELRDISAQTGFPWAVVWPTQPE